MKLFEIQEGEMEQWLKDRPPVIAQMFRKRPPNLLYKINPSGSKGTIYSYSEDGTISLAVSGEYCLVQFPSRVFGVSIDNIEECEPDEQVGTLCNTDEEILAVINRARERLGNPPLTIEELDSMRGQDPVCAL